MKAFFTFLAAVIVTAGVWAQSPMKMSYQAVIRNSGDELVTNQPIGLRISIIQGSANGTLVYTETQASVSNSIGLVSIEVGGDAGFDAINWADGPYFIKTETDPEGGTNYTISNTSQLLSVPYALHAKTAEAFSDGITETDPIFGASPAKTISGSDITNWNNKQDKLITGKNIIINGDTISATGLPPDGSTPGEMLYWNGSAWVIVPPGTYGKILYFCNGVPTWGGCTPLLSTAVVHDITPTTATSGGYATNDGGFQITARGICWSTLANPAITDNHSIDGSDTGTFISSLTNLLPNTIYFARTYATNSIGTAYGNEVSFTTASLNQNTVCFALPDGTNDYNWSYKDYVIPQGYKVDSVFMDASRPGYSEDKYDLLIAYCPGTSAYASSKVIFLFDYAAITTPMYNTWLNLTNLSVKATGMVRVKLPTHERAVWNNLCFAISEITDSSWKCGESFTVNHVAGAVAPVSKTVTYGTVTNIPGEPTKCWITQNLGADHQAISFNDSTDASAGWYWQFNRKQGYMLAATGITPLWTLSYKIYADSNWASTNDPCTIELGNGWRIPTYLEWKNVYESGNWVAWENPLNTKLKLHGAGLITSMEGSHEASGKWGTFWCSQQENINYGKNFEMNYSSGHLSTFGKGFGMTLRCITDASSQASIPTVTTSALKKFDELALICGGNITSDGGSTITARGICWNTNSSPTITNNHTVDGNGTGNFTSFFYEFAPNTTYYVRAYATNSVGTAYGNEISYTTSSNYQCKVAPLVTTNPASMITARTAIGSGEITLAGDPSLSDRGVYYSTKPDFNPFSDPHTTIYSSGGDPNIFLCNICCLSPGTTYYVYAYATNCAGTGYGEVLSFTTLPDSNFICGDAITISHIAGSVAPVTKTVTYGTVTNIPGEPSKCWITQNLGADHKATAVDDTTEASAGWYWQFNRKQGYKHDGTTRTPNTPWIYSINENSDWIPQNDPCTLELGNGWRIPTSTEWTNVDLDGGDWDERKGDWNSALKLHIAGNIEYDGSLVKWLTFYGSSTQRSYNMFWLNNNNINYTEKGVGLSIRCIRD